MKQKTFLCAMLAALFLAMSACGASSSNSAAADTAAAEPAMAMEPMVTFWRVTSCSSRSKGPEKACVRTL